MHIVGGLYREQCCIPAWDTVSGSGVRAATAVSKLSAGTSLYTYTDDFSGDSILLLRELGIVTRLSPRPTPIVFSYFHPLSRPHIQPPREVIETQQSIKVSGDAILRFGFLEGNAIVDANRAVYDPQTWRDPDPFYKNGSTANKLAVVLNEIELKATAGISDIEMAAAHLIEKQNTEIVIVKRGVQGALVFERTGQISRIPAYRSSRVFKIGTGDVFSAAFAYYWAEKKIMAVDAADIASRMVAAYCSTAQLPLSEDELCNMEPIKSKTQGPVLIDGAINTLGQRFTMEEAQFVLSELGMEVICPALDSYLVTPAKALLLIAEGFENELPQYVHAKAAEIPIIVLQGRGVEGVGVLADLDNVTVIDDFSTALYSVAWAAMENAD